MTDVLDPNFFEISPAGPSPKDGTFVIDEETKANWFLSKLAAIRAEQTRVKSQAETRVAELDADYNRINGRYGQQLESWAKMEAERRRRKTVTLQQGSISITNYAPKPIVTSLEDAIQTARLIAPDAVITEEVPEVPAVPARTETRLDDKVLFAAYLAATTGATNEDGSPLTLPGLSMTEARETIKVSFGKEPKDTEKSPQPTAGV